MNDTEPREGSRSALPAPDGDEIAQLLRLSGPRPAVPGDRADRVRAALRVEWQRVVRARRRRFVLAVAAGILTLVGFAAMFPSLLRERRKGAVPVVREIVARVEKVAGAVRSVPIGEPIAFRVLRPGDAVLAGTAIETGVGGRAALRLANGDSVRLNIGTRLALESQTVVALDRGTVYLETGSGRGDVSRVGIRTALGLVRDIGTQFEVSSRSGTVRVRVREGAVIMDRDEGSYEAEAGSELTIGTGGVLARRTLVTHGPAWDWVLQIAPGFELEGRTLAEFLGWVSRETGRTMRFGDPEIEGSARSVILHGSVRHLTPEEALAAVLPTCGLGQRVDGDTLVVDPEFL